LHILIVIGYRSIISPFQVSWNTMAPILVDKGWVIIKKVFNNYSRWDIVIIKPLIKKNGQYLIKRIIWLPWEDIKIEDWNVFIKKQWEDSFLKIDESKYLSEENNGKTYLKWDKNIFLVPEWKYFMMGDNRQYSVDSRSCFSYSCKASKIDNFITEDQIDWKVIIK
jgi:signal peptidase I